MRQKIPDEIAAAAGDDAAPLLSILPELVALKRIDFIPNEANDGHGAVFTISDAAEITRLRFINGSANIEP